MNKAKNIFQVFQSKKTIVLILSITVFLVGVIFLFTNNANAIVSTVATDISSGDFGIGGMKMKQSSDFRPAIKIQFGSDENTETLTSIAVAFTGTAGTPTWTNTSAVSSELLDLATINGGVSLWKESGSAVGFQSANAGQDTQVTLAATPVYGASNTFTITPAVAPTLATDDIYYIALLSDSSGITNNNAFRFILAGDSIVTSVTSP